MSDAATETLAGTGRNMVPRPFRVTGTRRDTHDTVTLSLEPVTGPPLSFQAGQFTMLYALGAGEVPISISGDPGRPEVLLHTIRDVGGITSVLAAASPGDVLGVRGPFGTAWRPGGAAGGDLFVVAGGIGLAPLRPALLEALAHRDQYRRVVLLYGARTPADLLYTDEIDRWRTQDGLEAWVTVDSATSGWRGHVGVVTTLIAKSALDPASTLALVCGPEVMMRFVIGELSATGVRPKAIRLSMERNMQCGIGLCGHCQLREYFICLDGPVFCYHQLAPVMTVPEI